MSEFVSVAKVGAIEEGRGATFAVNGNLVAVFLEKGRYHAIDDMCPHMGASLGTGDCENGVVTCPWHAWRFDVTSGAWRDNPKLKVACYEVRVEGEDIQVKVTTKKG